MLKGQKTHNKYELDSQKSEKLNTKFFAAKQNADCVIADDNQIPFEPL